MRVSQARLWPNGIDLLIVDLVVHGRPDLAEHLADVSHHWRAASDAKRPQREFVRRVKCSTDVVHGILLAAVTLDGDHN